MLHLLLVLAQGPVFLDEAFPRGRVDILTECLPPCRFEIRGLCLRVENFQHLDFEACHSLEQSDGKRFGCRRFAAGERPGRSEPVAQGRMAVMRTDASFSKFFFEVCRDSPSDRRGRNKAREALRNRRMVTRFENLCDLLPVSWECGGGSVNAAQAADESL